MAKARVDYFATTTDPKAVWFAVYVRKNDTEKAKVVIETLHRKTT